MRSCDGPLYNHYDEGGYLIWFTPTKPVFVDNRQDPFPLQHIVDALAVERGKAPYRPLFDRWGIRCVFLSVGSPTLAALDRDEAGSRAIATTAGPCCQRWLGELAARDSFGDMAVGLLYVAFAVRAALMSAVSDTFWHLRAGADIWRTGRVPLVDTYSYTAAGLPWPDHEWLWETFAFGCHRLGGMPLATAGTAALLVAALAPFTA